MSSGSSLPEERAFHDLPSDDSCLEESDSDLEIDRSALVPVDDDDDNSDSDSDNNDSDSDEDSASDMSQSQSPHEPIEDDDDEEGVVQESSSMSLADRLHAKRQHGVEGGRLNRGKRKSEALQIAQARLLELNKKKRNETARTKKRSLGQESNSDDNGSDDGEDGDEVEESTTSTNRKKKKKSKHAPATASSLRSDYYNRGAPDLNSSGIGVSIGAHRYKPRDPRMQSLSGHLDQDTFEKRYQFLEEMQEEEITKLQGRCKAWKMTGKKGQRARRKLGLTSMAASAAEGDEVELKRLMQERSSRLKERTSRTKRREIKKKLRDGVASGKRGAYYLKKRDLKKLEMGQKFDELNTKGGETLIEKTLAKKRKKNMGKASGIMPE